jgi:hypothetical protein
MLEVLVALDETQRHMKNLFEMEAPTRAKARRADRKHRSPLRAGFALAIRVLASVRTRHRSGQRSQPASSEGSGR